MASEQLNKELEAFRQEVKRKAAESEEKSEALKSLAKARAELEKLKEKSENQKNFRGYKNTPNKEKQLSPYKLLKRLQKEKKEAAYVRRYANQRGIVRVARGLQRYRSKSAQAHTRGFMNALSQPFRNRPLNEFDLIFRAGDREAPQVEKELRSFVSMNSINKEIDDAANAVR